MVTNNRRGEGKAGGLYYIYSRGIDGKEIFAGKEEAEYMCELFGRYLGEIKCLPRGFEKIRPYIARKRDESKMREKVKLLAFGLEKENMRMVLEQAEVGQVVKFIQRLMTSFGMFYNKKYNRRGPLFEGRQRLIEIVNPADLMWWIRKTCRLTGGKSVKRFGLVETVSVIGDEQIYYSSRQDYLKNINRDWLATGRAEELIGENIINNWGGWEKVLDGGLGKWAEEEERVCGLLNRELKP